ncbi:hypothetical protein ECG_08369 [Echinococcus granulosus]|nr:hypothetical protein ECG_08369 [Echinococcus granulosus]
MLLFGVVLPLFLLLLSSILRIFANTDWQLFECSSSLNKRTEFWKNLSRGSCECALLREKDHLKQDNSALGFKF